MAKAKQDKRARRSLTDELKQGVVRLVLDEGRSVTDVARSLDLTVSALRGWVEQARADRSAGKTIAGERTDGFVTKVLGRELGL